MHSRLAFSRKSLVGGLMAAAGFVTGQAAYGQSFGVICNFGGRPGGHNPTAGLTYANGTFYGTTTKGGAPGPNADNLDNGTVFSITGGTEQVISSFGRPPDGNAPTGGLIDGGEISIGPGVIVSLRLETGQARARGPLDCVSQTYATPPEP